MRDRRSPRYRHTARAPGVLAGGGRELLGAPRQLRAAGARSAPYPVTGPGQACSADLLVLRRCPRPTVAQMDPECKRGPRPCQGAGGVATT